MTTAEALTILREARDIYSNIDHLKIKPIGSARKRHSLDSSILIYYAFASTQVRESAFKNWRKYAWPLYHAIEMARKRCELTNLPDPIKVVETHYNICTPESQMITLINISMLAIKNKWEPIDSRITRKAA